MDHAPIDGLSVALRQGKPLKAAVGAGRVLSFQFFGMLYASGNKLQ